MTTSELPAPTPEDVPGNRYRCNCGWSHTVAEDPEGCKADTDVILLHIRGAHPEVVEKIRAEQDKRDREAERELLVEIERLAQERGLALAAVAAAEKKLKELLPVAVEHGIPETEISHYSGISRMTVRRWLGK